VVLNGVSENPRGCSDPNPEGEHLQKDSRKNGNGSRQVASPTKAVPCGNECRKSKTKRCHEDYEKQVARKNLKSRKTAAKAPWPFPYFRMLLFEVRRNARFISAGSSDRRQGGAGWLRTAQADRPAWPSTR
jgi:hypothetical protein